MAWWIVFPEARRVGPFATSWQAASNLGREEVRILMAHHAGSPLIRFLREGASGGVATLERPPVNPPTPPLTGERFDRQYRLDDPTPRRTRPLAPPEQQTRPPAKPPAIPPAAFDSNAAAFDKKQAAFDKKPAAISANDKKPAAISAKPAAISGTSGQTQKPDVNPSRWILPLHQHPPLEPDDNSLMNRVPLAVWVERGVAPSWLPPSTAAAAYVRLFGIGPPRATWTTGARAARGYTPREIRLILKALQLTADS